jgi:hypothetical protein
VQKMTRQFVRASIAGIVYLIDSQKGRVYTYNPDAPVYLGDLERIANEELVTSEGNLTGAKLNLRPDWEQVMKVSLEKQATKSSSSSQTSQLA